MGFVLLVGAIENQVLKRKYIYMVAKHWEDVTRHTNDAHRDLEKCDTRFCLLAATEMAPRKILFFISLMGIKPYWSGFHNCLVSKMSLKLVGALSRALRVHIAPINSPVQSQAPILAVLSTCN